MDVIVLFYNTGLVCENFVLKYLVCEKNIHMSTLSIIAYL